MDLIRLVLSLLKSGLSCLSEARQEGADGGADGLAFAAIGAAVNAIGAIAASYALDVMIGCGRGADQPDAHQPGGGKAGAGAGAEDGGQFPGVLWEALSLVTSAVCRDVVGEARREKAAATVRSLPAFIRFITGHSKPQAVGEGVLGMSLLACDVVPVRWRCCLAVPFNEGERFVNETQGLD